MNVFYKKLLAVIAVSFALGYGLNLTLDAFAATAQSGGIAPHCQRHGHNDEKYCSGEAAYFGASAGYARYSGTYRVTGHRHGGSEIETIYCMGGPSQGNSCNWFHAWGDGLGYEYGDVHPMNQYQAGSFSNFDNPDGPGAVWTIFERVKDAEVTVELNYSATPMPDEPGPINPGPGVHLACGNGACVSVPNGYPGQPNDDGCTSLGAGCGGGEPGPGGGESHLECVNDACQYVNGGGPNQNDCSSAGERCGNGGPACNPPHSVNVNGRCVPSCGAAGGNSCSAADCAGRTNLEAYDCNPCCTTGTGPSQRYSCQGSACVADDNGPFASADCAGSCGENPPGTRYRCANGACVEDRGGSYGSYGSCAASCAPPTHAVCQGSACVVVNGGGTSECSQSSDCQHTTCTPDGACATVAGRGASQCSNDYPDCPQPPPTCTLSAVPARIVIPPSQPITLTWSCTPTRMPTNCSITNVGGVGTSGSLVVRPTSSLTYALTCSNGAGTGGATVKTRVFTGDPGSLIECNPGNPNPNCRY